MAQRIVVVDSQKLSTIQACMKQFQYSHIEQYEPHIKPDYFERGDLTHEGLKIYYRLKKYRLRWAMNNHSHERIIDICVHVMRFKAIKTNLDYEDVEINCNTFRQYCQHFENDGWDNILAVEEVGSFVLWENEDLLILYEMKIDLIISLPQMAILPIDHKSGKMRVNPNLVSNQFKGYCVGLKVNNLYQNQIGFQKTLKPVEKFQRHLLSFDDNILNEWKDESAWWIRHGLDLIDRGIFPHNWTSCDKYAGCIYKNVCTKEPVVREQYLLRDFNKREVSWDPGSSL